MRLLLFEDNDSFRQSLRSLFGELGGHDVVGDFARCADVRRLVQETGPDLVLMDIDMPEMDGVAGLRLLRSQDRHTPVVMLTVFDDDRLFESLKAGANGYLLKKTHPAQLLEAIEEIGRGGAPLSPVLARKLIQTFDQTTPPAAEFRLSAREVEILDLLVKGYTNKMIAATCFIAPETVSSHLKNIYAKLHVSCGKEAVAVALRRQIVR